MKDQKNIEILNNGKKFTFRSLSVNDKDWINSRFAEEKKPVGYVNFQEKISNFDNYAELAQALTIIMHYLLVFPENITLEQFEEKFGVTYNDIAVLYAKGLNFCIGNTEKDVKKNLKIVRQNNKLRRQNMRLQQELLLEKCKTLGGNLKGLII